jgi:hypothetical protein
MLDGNTLKGKLIPPVSLSNSIKIYSPTDKPNAPTYNPTDKHPSRRVPAIENLEKGLIFGP